ncbi:MarR family transcriptional regulator [Alistipes sp.]|uniref:MarR family transcriptional regulator n=1 Tax=Alistipes sp. TaxID=1872444 RepID=UPI003A853CEA
MNTLCRIREVSRAVAEFEQRFEREYGLTMNEGVLLCCLDRYGERSSGEIAEALQLTCSNASKVIRSVESRGFINRKLGTDDKRQMYFSLTPQGRAELSRLHPCAVAMPELLQRLLEEE